MTIESKTSNAMTILLNMWQGGLNVKPFSEARLRNSMSDTLQLVITAGLEFNKSDFSNLSTNFHLGSGYYYESYLDTDEYYYSIAVAVENISACKSFEQAVNRKPFITDNVKTMDINYAGHLSGFNQKRRSRLSRGCEFIWNKELAHVTSFAKDNSYLVACSYKPREKALPCPTCQHGGNWEMGELKIAHLYKIMHKDLEVKL
jgi:hypothetical protein